MFNNAKSNNRKSSKSQSRRERSMQIEALESRELLSVSPLYPNISGGIPALVAPLGTVENVEPKHEFIADLSDKGFQSSNALSSSSSIDLDSVHNSEIQTSDSLLAGSNDNQSLRALSLFRNNSKTSKNGIDTYTVYTPDKDEYFGVGERITLIFEIDAFDETKDATLVLRVHDVDYNGGKDEWDEVSINGHTLDKPLTGANESWSEPSFKFSASYLKVGKNEIVIDPSVRDPNWVVACDYGKLSVTQEATLSIESVSLKDRSGNRETFEKLGEKDVEDAFIKQDASIQTTLKMDDSIKTKTAALAAISNITLRVEKVNDDGTYTVVETIKLSKSKIEKYTKSADAWNSSSHTLTIDKNDWKPKDGTFGNIRITCTVTPKKKGASDISKVVDHLRIGVTEYDVSFGRATVDEATGGVKSINGENLEHSFDRNVSTVNFTKLTMERKYYDMFFLNTTKSSQWEALVFYLVNNKQVSIDGYDFAKNAISEDLAKKTEADQMKMLKPLLKLFSDYHFYVLLGKETGNTYDVNKDGIIDNPKSDIMRTIYVPSLADTASYSTDDANVEILSRMIAYEDWQKLGKDVTRPGSLIIYTKWFNDTFDMIKGGGKIILTPYIVAFAKETYGGNTSSSAGFQGFGLMNATVSADSCEDNFFVSRGTEFSLIKPSDIITDVMREGVGYYQYQNAKTDVLNWIASLKNGSVTLTGHSLGGALSQWFASGCVDRGIINKIKKITTFNSPSISSSAADKFNDNYRGIDIDHYVSNGDFVSFAGEKFIGNANTTNVHLITYCVEYTLNGKRVDLLGREVNNDGFLYKLNPDGTREETKEYGDFGSGYKHGMWLANKKWRDLFFNYEVVENGVRSSQYKLLGELDISIDTLNSYWFHWTQTGYLGPIKVNTFDMFKSSFVRGTTEQLRKGIVDTGIDLLESTARGAIKIITSPNFASALVSVFNTYEDIKDTLNNWLGNNFFTGFDVNGSNDRNYNEWWLSSINKPICFYKTSEANHGCGAIGIANLTTLSRMKLSVFLDYVYLSEQAPRTFQDCLLNDIIVGDVSKNTLFGDLFTLAEDTLFVFSSDTYNAKMNNDSVELMAYDLKLNGFGADITGESYSEKTSGSSMDLTNLVFETGSGDVMWITADVTGKKMDFDYSKPVTKATANADLIIKLYNQDEFRLTNAQISFGEKANEITATNGTFNGFSISSAKLTQSYDSNGITWKVSSIVSSDNREYKYINGQWVLPAKKEQEVLGFGFANDSTSSPQAYGAQNMADGVIPLRTPVAADNETRVLAFSWSNPIENPNLIFKIGDTIYTESEMIANGYLLLYTKSDTFRNYIVKDDSADISTWQFNSTENLSNVQVLLQTFEGDLTPALVSTVNATIFDDSKVNVEFAVENMSPNSLIQMAVCQTGQTEDVLNFYVPVSEMTPISGGYSYTFDLAAYNLSTGDYQIYAWSDESMRENAAVSGSFHVEIEGALVLSQSSLSFDDTNAMQESAVKQLTITNSGNAKSYYALSLANPEGVLDADFSISGVYSNGEAAALDYIELGAGESVTLDIQFTPQSEGNKLWNVELVELSSSEKCGEFMLSGTGLALLATEVSIEADDASLSETHITSGDSLYVTGTLRNTGDNISGAITVSLYASQNSNDLTGGVLLSSQEGIVLDGQTEETIPFYINSTSALSEGDWYLGLVIDCSNDTLTTNNASAFSDFLTVEPEVKESVLQNVTVTTTDENNNDFYDSLKVSAAFNAQTAGKYTIAWSLWDNDLQKVTELSKEYSLRKGTNTVTANLNGNDIFRNGVDGPYTISAVITSTNDSWYEPEVIVTSAYNANQFEGGQFTVGPYSDFGKDNNSNGEFDTLCVSVEISSACSGNYTIYGTLNNDSGIPFEASATVSLNANESQNVELDFDLTDILMFGSSASFELSSLTIAESASGNELVELNNVYSTTGDYSSANVELPNVMFTGNNTTEFYDEDNDGLYDALILKIGVTVAQSGDYTINGLLINENSEPFYNIHQQCHLDEDSSFVEISIDGLTISDGNFNNTLTLVGLQALDEDQNVVAIGNTTTISIPDKYAFVHRLVQIVDDFEISSIGKTISLKFNVLSENGGYYNVNARLLDANGEEVCWNSNTFMADANQTTEVTLVFELSEADIESHGNVFTVGSLTLYNTNESSELDSLYLDDVAQIKLGAVDNNHDAACLLAFLEQTDANGVKNGQKMSDNYDPNDTTTWSGVIWAEIDGVPRVTNIYWYDMGMVGTLDLSGCSELAYLYCYSNELTELNVSGCTALKKLYCDRNQLTSLDVTNNTELTLLACYSNQLSELDLSQNTQLTYLACYSNPLTTLDVSNNPQLTTAYCWNPDLERIEIDPDAEGLSVFLDYSDSTWTYQDADGETLSTGVTRFIYNASDSVVLPVYATNESGSQSIAIAASAVDPDQSVLPAPTLTVAATGIDSISVTVGEVENATGYTLQYSVNPNFTDAVTENVSAGVTDINGLNVNTTYFFRVLAIGSDDFASSNYSAVQSVKTECIQLAEPTLQNAVPSGYGAISVTVGEVENASGYLLEYSTSEDFSDASSMNVSAGDTTVKGLNAGTTYYFRAQALGTGDYSNSDYSDVLSAKVDDLKVSINGKKVVVEWYDESPAADSIRYRVAGTTRWTTSKLKAGVTTYSFNASLGSDYEIEVLLDQQEGNVLQGSAVVLDQPKLSSVKNELTEDSFQVNVTNYAAKNLAANVNQAIVTVNGVPTTVDIADQQGESELPDGGKVSFNNGLFTFTEMASNTSYKVQVAFADGNSVSTASSALTVKTAKTFYLAPTITSAVAVSDSCIDVTWETSYGAKSTIEAQKYTVQYSTDGLKWSNATTSATGNSYTIQKLKGGVEYQVRVLATKDNAFNASDPSNVLTTETIALPKISLVKNSVQDDSFQMNVTNYQNTNLTKATTINVKSDKFGTTVVFLLNGSGSATFANGMTVSFNNGLMTFANVPSNTQQKIQINFKEGACTTAWSQALTVKTLVAPYNKPVLTSATALSSTSVVVNWNTVFGKNSTTKAQSYTVQYSTDGERWTNATTSATGTSYTVTKLKPNTKYLFAVVANKDSNFNASQPSNSLLETTLN